MHEETNKVEEIRFHPRYRLLSINILLNPLADNFHNFFCRLSLFFPTRVFNLIIIFI